MRGPAVLGWSPLLRRLLRILAGRAILEVLRSGQRATHTRRERPTDKRRTIIDLQRVDDERPFDRFSEASRRVVARAVAVQGGADISSETLLLALIESHGPSAERLARAGTDLDALRRHLHARSGTASDRRPTPDARRTLRQAPILAEARASGEVEPRDLLEALLAPGSRLAGVVDRYATGGPAPPPG